MDNDDEEAEEEYSTDQDQDNSFEMNSTSGSDDLNMNEEEMRNFDIHTATHSKHPPPAKKSVLFEENVDHSATKTAAHPLQNPGQLISDFYISNMNYAMRYSVEYVQQVAKDLRARRERLDSMNIGGHSVTPLNKHQRQHSFNRLHRSSSVDRLYAVRREHIRYANGADEYFGARNISFTTDDIQDIYMPSAIDNYKRKIAVELERRRRFAQLEQSMNEQQEHQQQRAFSPVQFEESVVNSASPVVLDDLDLFIIKKAKSSIETERLLAEEQKLKIFQPHVQRDKRPTQLNSVLVGEDPDFDLISRVHVKSPRFEFESEEPVHLERAAQSRVQEGFTNFALINKVSTLMDNEVIPSSSSDSESMSVSPVDSLNNLNMDSFGRPSFDSPRPKYKEQTLSFLSYSTATIEQQQVKLEKTHVRKLYSIG